MLWKILGIALRSLPTHFCPIDDSGHRTAPDTRGLVIFLIHRSVLLSFFRCLEPMLLGRMDEAEDELLHPEEIQRRFKTVFGRDMTRNEPTLSSCGLSHRLIRKKKAE